MATRRDDSDHVVPALNAAAHAAIPRTVDVAFHDRPRFGITVDAQLEDQAQRHRPRLVEMLSVDYASQLPLPIDELQIDPSA